MCVSLFSTRGEQMEKAKEFFNYFFTEKFDKAFEMESDSIKSQFGIEQMKEAYKSFLSNYGSFKEVKNITSEEKGGMNVFTFYSQFENKYLNVFVVLDQKGEVVQFVAQPAAAPSNNDQDKKQDVNKIPDEYFNSFFSKNYDKAASLQDDVMNKNFGKDAMEKVYNSLISQYGNVLKVLSKEEENQSGYNTYKYYTEFSKGYLYITIIINGESKVAGFRYENAPIPDGKEKTPDYVDKSKYKETDITLDASPFKVDGKLVLPVDKEEFPIVIMISGSGPNDMNETIGPNAPFRDIGLGLASNGIATIRFNKTTYQEPQLFMKEGSNLKNEYFLTAEAAYDFAKKVEGADKIILLGHSEGGYIVPEIYNIIENADGLILLAANARKLSEVILSQTEYVYENTKTISEEQMKNAKDFYQKLINQEIPSDTQLGGVITAEYYYELDKYLPIPILQKVDIPVLISQGTEDFQVSVEKDYGLFKKELESQKNFSFRAFENLSHIFNYAKPGVYHSVNDYYVQDFVHEEVIKYLVSWINGL